MAFFILTILMLTIVKFRHKCSLVKLNIVTFTSALFHVKVNHHYTWAHFCWHYILEQLYGVIKAFIFQVYLLPELLGKWYSRPSVPRCKSADQLTMKEHEAIGSAKILFLLLPEAWRHHRGVDRMWQSTLSNRMVPPKLPWHFVSSTE